MSTFEKHPLTPFLPSNAKILMLGTFPPKREKWCMDFFYPNFQNDMWRIFGKIFFNDTNYFILPNQKNFDKDAIEKFLIEKQIAIFDTALEVNRLKDNASDAFLEIKKTINLTKILEQIPQCVGIVTTGAKASETLAEICKVKSPNVGEYIDIKYCNRTFKFFRMPSSSRAYPRSINFKADFYKQMFKLCKIL